MGCGRQGTTDCCQDIGCKGKGDEEREGDAAAAVFAACAFGRFLYVEDAERGSAVNLVGLCLGWVCAGG